MIEYGHICLLVFAQGIWKENYKLRVFDEIRKIFLSSMDIDAHDEWSEISQSPLFDPKNPGEDGQPCDLCHALNKIYEEKKGINEGLILFSHNILGWEGTINVLSFILGQKNVKKLFYLELDWESYTTNIGSRIPQVLKNIKEKQINRTKLFDLLEKEQVEFSILYEVLKH
ncbi:MAG: hypothetical protein ACXACY_06960 [Candidatus Hodarchaeales archaeon]